MNTSLRFLRCCTLALFGLLAAVTPALPQPSLPNETEIEVGLPPNTQIVKVQHRGPKPAVRWTTRATSYQYFPSYTLPAAGCPSLIGGPNRYHRVEYKIVLQDIAGAPSSGYAGEYLLVGVFDPSLGYFRVTNNWHNLPMWGGFPRGTYYSTYGLDGSFSTRNTPDPETEYVLTDDTYKFTSSATLGDGRSYRAIHDLRLTELAGPTIVPERTEAYPGGWSPGAPTAYLYDNQWTKSEYQLIAPPSLTGTLRWAIEFTPANGGPKTYTPQSWTIDGPTSPTFAIDPKALNPTTNGDYAIVFLPLEVESRDRGIAGYLTVPVGANSFSLSLEVNGQSLGTYDLTTPDATHIYASEDAVFSDDEVTLYDQNKLQSRPPLKQVTQPVTFIRYGDAIRFVTVSDTLGTLTARLTINGQTVASVTHQLTAEEDFRRLIASVAGLVGGTPAPQINAWAGFPTTNPAPPVSEALRQALPSIIAAAPAGPRAAFLAAIPLESEGVVSPGLFEWFVFEVATQPVYSDDGQPDTWTQAKRDNFFALLGNYYNTAEILGPTILPPPLLAPSPLFAPPPPAVTLPFPIPNRGLVAKSLLFLITRAVEGQIAFAEGAVFGIWDGIKGDVEGVIDTLRMAPELVSALQDPYKTAGELWHTFLLVKEIKWEGVKNGIRGMITEFIGTQKERLALALPDQAENPEFLAAYLAGYTAGFIGEQVVVSVATAGIGKIGWVGRSLRKGSEAVKFLVNTVGPARAQTHKVAKGVSVEFARCATNVDELRAARRNGSLCGTIAGCLASGTLVVMADGSLRRIDDIRAGDRVLTRSAGAPDSWTTETVRAQIMTTAESTVTLRWDEDGDREADGLVTATREHPFFVPGAGWRAAATLHPGMAIETSHGSATLLDVVRNPTTTVTYNLDVDGPNTFLVSSDGFSAALVHNEEGDVYNYKQPHRPKGQSQLHVKDQITGAWVPQFHSNGAPRMVTNPQHHFFWDAWLREHFTSYRPRKDPFPCIELSSLDHAKAHDAARDWFARNTTFGREGPKGLEWKNFDLKQMEDLSETMMRAINLPEIKLNTLKGLSSGYLRTQFNLIGCGAP